MGFLPSHSCFNSIFSLYQAAKDDLNQEECKCQIYSACAWSDQVTKQISVLSRNSSQWHELVLQFEIQICDREKRFVWCCSNGEQASNSELQKLKKRRGNEAGFYIYR